MCLYAHVGPVRKRVFIPIDLIGSCKEEGRAAAPTRKIASQKPPNVGPRPAHSISLVHQFPRNAPPIRSVANSNSMKQDNQTGNKTQTYHIQT